MKTIRMTGEGQVIVIRVCKNRVVEVLPLKNFREEERSTIMNSLVIEVTLRAKDS